MREGKRKIVSQLSLTSVPIVLFVQNVHKAKYLNFLGKSHVFLETM